MVWLDALIERLTSWLRRRVCPPPQPLHEMDDLTLHLWCQREIKRIETAADTGEEPWQ
jgi:hypothetical protein